MNPFEICIAYISWDTGGKRRPVLLIEKCCGRVEVFRITSQYETKSELVQANYFKIDDWRQAGLSKQSYIDTGSSIDIPISLIASTIGKLTENDKQRLLRFINS